MTAAVENARVTILEDRVTKYQSIDATQREIEGTQLASEIARNCGLFSVPSVIESNPESGLIVFERISGADTLRVVLPRIEVPEILVERAAEILARIHGASVGGSVFIHGDFTIENLLYEEKQDRMTVIDWSTPAWLGAHEARESSHDIAMFLMSLFNRPVFYHHRIRDVPTLARCFLSRYSEYHDLDTKKLANTSDTLLSLYLPYYRRKIMWRYVANYPSIRRFRRFVRNIGV